MSDDAESGFVFGFLIGAALCLWLDPHVARVEFEVATVACQSYGGVKHIVPSLVAGHVQAQCSDGTALDTPIPTGAK